MITNKLKKAVGTLILATGLSSAAWALPITGTIDLAGGATLDSTSLASATKVVSWGVVTVASPFGVEPGTVLDSTINPGDTITMASGSWTFGSGKTALWSVGGFTFDLTSSWIVMQNSTFLAVAGTGTISGMGYDPTPGSWAFTSQGAGKGTAAFSFSATSGAAPVRTVPDGGTTAVLLGCGLVGVALVSRRFGRTV